MDPRAIQPSEPSQWTVLLTLYHSLFKKVPPALALSSLYNSATYDNPCQFLMTHVPYIQVPCQISCSLP